LPDTYQIWFNNSDAGANTVGYAPISDLPFVPAVSGTQYTLPMFATGSTLGDSIVSQNAGATQATVTGILDVTSYIEVGSGNFRILGDGDSIFISSRTTVPGSNDVRNTALGTVALQSLTNTVGASGSDNTAVGYRALENLTTGYNNTVLGSGAGKQLTTAHSCIAIGQGALDVATGNNNSHSIAIGSNALGSLNDPSSNAGIYNVAIGSGAALNKSSGKKNVFIGGNAAYNKASGDENVYIGSDVAPGATVESGATTIGYGINSNGSNTITLGHGSATVFYGGQNGIDIGSTAKPWGDMHGNYGYFTRVGIGTAPQAELDILTSARIMRFSGDSLTVLNTNSTSGYFNIYSTNVTVQNGTLSAQKLLSLYDNTAGSVDINVNLSSTDSGSVTKYSGISFIRANETLRLGAKTSVASPVTAATAFIVQNTGKIQGGAYGSGTNTGTPTYNLEVDSSGNVIETSSTNPGGNGGTFSGSKDIDAGGVIKVFTLTRATTGCLVFDVFFTADFVSGVGGGPPIAEKWTVVHGISQTPVYNKIISNDGQFGTGGYDVTFADASSGTAVECSVAQRSGSSYPSLSYTIIVGYSENNALTFTPA
jgi:hypothetical protein